MLELQCTESLVRASKYTNDVFSATKQMKRIARPRMLKASFSVRESANELFCRASHVRASMHRITGLDLLRTLMLCLVQLSKWRESKATDAEKLLSERKLLNAILRVTLKYMKDVSFSWNEMLFAMQKTDFMFRAFLRAKNTNAVRAKNTNAVFSATKQMKRMQGDGCWKVLSQWEKGAKCNFKEYSSSTWKMFLLWNEMLFAMQKTDFMC